MCTPLGDWKQFFSYTQTELLFHTFINGIVVITLS